MVLIYRIDGGNLTYVGSTIQKLQCRLSKHKDAYKRWKKGKSRYMTSFDVVQHDHKITLIEECTEEARQEREGYWIRTLTCVNKVVVDRTAEQWREQNRNEINEYSKNWCKQPWYCEVCDKTITRVNKSKHLKSRRHQECVKVSTEH